MKYLTYPKKEKLKSKEWNGSTKLICIFERDNEKKALDDAISMARDAWSKEDGDIPTKYGIPNKKLIDHFEIKKIENLDNLIQEFNLNDKQKEELEKGNPIEYVE